MGYNYYYRADKLSVRKEPYKRNIRVERAFGEEYSIENIKNKICSRYPSREEVKKMDKYSEQIRFICKYKLENINDIEYLKEEKKRKITKDFEYKE